MNWGYRLVGDALADLKDLEISVQEAVLDELDGLCSAAPSRAAMKAADEVFHDFEWRDSGKRFVVFVRLRRDDERATFTVLGIAAVTTPMSA